MSQHDSGSRGVMRVSKFDSGRTGRPRMLQGVQACFTESGCDAGCRWLILGLSGVQLTHFRIFQSGFREVSPDDCAGSSKQVSTDDAFIVQGATWNGLSGAHR